MRSKESSRTKDASLGMTDSVLTDRIIVQGHATTVAVTVSAGPDVAVGAGCGVPQATKSKMNNQKANPCANNRL
jgi:hypothetical protein